MRGSWIDYFTAESGKPVCIDVASKRELERETDLVVNIRQVRDRETGPVVSS